jgi:hypothetical protein
MMHADDHYDCEDEDQRPMISNVKDYLFKKINIRMEIDET